MDENRFFSCPKIIIKIKTRGKKKFTNNISWGAIFLGGNFPGGNFTGGIFPGGIFPRTVFGYLFLYFLCNELELCFPAVTCCNWVIPRVSLGFFFPLLDSSLYLSVIAKYFWSHAVNKKIYLTKRHIKMRIDIPP